MVKGFFSSNIIDIVFRKDSIVWVLGCSFCGDLDRWEINGSCEIFLILLKRILLEERGNGMLVVCDIIIGEKVGKKNIENWCIVKLKKKIVVSKLVGDYWFRI